ncbi:adaptin ear-binding coat-associated protein 1 NECAP-1 [Xylona heveae TC161]|uniref:Adaptin ear-binding coat-associated protein 1 NECAP-1 n=1 Tax=Xylona heveae (strain CBS 132557 / TC161) TaxID=1328760 RepID=A0A165HA62_XYLHT|nr:adaptin ear-binding coat-associated protein 1 NECAP-1 [Xylona heveae TC161]KZF23200.1 adaptin ear-binding coat-associated protein 1 NECAP-1 [Xylona heveae TC161]
MASVDPATGRPLPADAIQRVLFIAPKVHIYNIPPLTSTRGYTAAAWTENNNARLIFTARLRIVETAIPDQNGGERVKTDVLLEDPKDGQLFAAAPYSSPAAVEQVLDSSRFFAMTVVGERGQKAVLGIGFEERSDAFDFGVSLQEVRRVHGMDNTGQDKGRKVPSRVAAQEKPAEEKKDFSLKEGETITVNLGGRGRRTRNESGTPASSTTSEQAALFSIAPPPSDSSGGAVPFLPPPPSAHAVKEERRRGKPAVQPASQPSAADLGFDDGEFGEFQ